MEGNRQYGGFDLCKIAAAFLVVAIHTSPLVSFSTDADFILTRVFARVAVPFFLMVSGFFLLPQYLYQNSTDRRPILRFWKKTLFLYLLATLIYLPVSFYAGHLNGLSALAVFRVIVFDGTFYHLWYLPAAMLGVGLVYLLSRKLPPRAIIAVSLIFYLIGLLGDSYFGLADRIPALSAAYNGMFQLFAYTRNGIFYAPVFLVLGAWIGQCHRCNPQSDSKKRDGAGFVLFMILMTVEGLTLHHFGIQRHDSMYIMLLPVMFFLFRLVLSWNKKPSRNLREASMWIYLIHPLSIVVVRGAAKVAGLTELLVNNSLVHYLAVCALSCVFAFFVSKLPRRKPPFLKGRAWIEIDRESLRHNIRELQKLLPGNCSLMPAVKANAYGHGAVLISRECNAMGIDSFCVASVEEGVELRKNGIQGEILVLGYTHPEQFYLLRRYRLTQTVVDYSHAVALNHYGKKMKVHIGIDTGMHRLGERWEKTDRLSRIFTCENLVVEGAFSHLCADDTDKPEDKVFTLSQGRAFYDALDELKKRGYPCPKAHLLSSYGLFRYPQLAGDYVRIGIALYGMLSARADTEKIQADLQPVLSIKARVAAVKELAKGEAAGYGLQFIAQKDTRLAVLTIGYADGLPRALSCGVGEVIINGKKAPVAGRICMDQTIVDISSIPNVHPGDIAVIIGEMNGERITACDLAEQAGTIANEILSRLGSRLERLVV